MTLLNKLLFIFLITLPFCAMAESTPQPIEHIKQLSECRAVLDYYVGFITIATIVNSVIVGPIDAKHILDKHITALQLASSRLAIRQDLLVKNHLQHMPSDVMLDIIARSYADSMSMLDQRLDSPVYRDSGLSREKFFKEYAITYKKCTNFLYES